MRRADRGKYGCEVCSSGTRKLGCRLDLVGLSNVGSDIPGHSTLVGGIEKQHWYLWVHAENVAVKFAFWVEDDELCVTRWRAAVDERLEQETNRYRLAAAGHTQNLGVWSQQIIGNHHPGPWRAVARFGSSLLGMGGNPYAGFGRGSESHGRGGYATARFERRMQGES